MFRRLIVAVAVITCALALLTNAAGAKSVPASTWAPKFCSTLQSWEQKLTSDGNKADAALSGNVSNLSSAKSQLVTFLDKSVANTKNAVSALQTAGAPDTPNGSKIAARFVTGLQSAQRIFTAAAAKAHTLSTTSLKKFEATAKDLTGSLNKGGTAVTETFSGVAKLDSGGDLSRALQAEPSCAFLADGSGSTTTTG